MINASPIIAKTNFGTVSCANYGIRINGHPFEEDVTRSLPLCKPIGGRSNQMVKQQLKTWWEAQCVFRGLGTGHQEITTLDMALRAAPAAPMMEELKEMERGMMEEYRIKYKAAQKAREVARKKQIEEEQKKMDKWPLSLTMEEKLEACVYRVKAKCCFSVMDTARCLGLEVSDL